MISLTGKRALVTGGRRGIGEAAAELLRRAGAEVFSIARSTHGDLSDPAVVERAAVEIQDPLDILVLNHGVWPAEDVALVDMAPSQWHSTIAQNLSSYFYVVRAFAPRLRDGGAVVLVASTAAQRGEPFHADYAASKGAIVSLTKSLAVEMAPKIRVNCVAPGWVETDMCAAPLAAGGRERVAATIPLGRLAEPEEIAGPILFLCSDLARHVTGEILNVNGGSVLCG